MRRTHSLPRNTPESQGVSSVTITEFLEAVESELDSAHSVMVLRHGTVILEQWWAPYAADQAHMLFSLSKSFTSTAIGFAVHEGLLGLDDRVIDLLPDDAPAVPGVHLTALRVRHLLTMTTGHAAESLTSLGRDQDGNWAEHILRQPIEYEPGTHFVYNSGASYLLSAIIQRVTGSTLLAYLTPRLLDPLDIVGATWQTCPRGINTGGWGLSACTEDLAVFGQMLLQRGRWNDQQVVPPEWVDEATAYAVPNAQPGSNPDWSEGYGYQFWRCRNGAYRGDGAFGQFCIVMPEQDAVVVFTAGQLDMQAQLNLVWEKLLPAFGSEPLAEVSAPESGGRSRALAGPAGTSTADCDPRVSGVVWEFADGSTVQLKDNPAGWTLSLRLFDEDRSIDVGYASWTGCGTSEHLAATGAWVGPDLFEAKICYFDTPFILTASLDFGSEHVSFELSQNVAFDATALRKEVGRRRVPFRQGRHSVPVA
jgi:CubicO group peptidase (beta-lactamase class C family)